MKSKLNGKNKIQTINTWAVTLLRYRAGIINWKIQDFSDVWGHFIQRVTLIGYISNENMEEEL